MIELPGYLMFIIHIATLICLYAILALGLNLQMGYTGLPNWGVVGFFAIGAYSSAFLSKLGHPLVGIIAGMLIAMCVGIAFTFPAMRIRVDYFALMAIAFGEIVRIYVTNNDALGHKLGIYDVPRLFGLAPTEHKIASLLLVIGVVILIYAFIQTLIYYTPYGRILKAIRDEEDAVNSIGKNPMRYKLTIFCIGSLVSSFAGSLYTHTQLYIAPDSIIPYYTFLVWTMLLLGGIGNNKGVILGSIVLITIQQSVYFAKDELYRIFTPNQVISITQIATGILIILVLIYLPKGVIKEQKVTCSHIERVLKRKTVAKKQNQSLGGRIRTREKGDENIVKSSTIKHTNEKEVNKDANTNHGKC